MSKESIEQAKILIGRGVKAWTDDPDFWPASGPQAIPVGLLSHIWEAVATRTEELEAELAEARNLATSTIQSLLRDLDEARREVEGLKQAVAEYRGDGYTGQEEKTDPEHVARLFHENYERLASEFGYKTREASAVPWDDVPGGNQDLMVETAKCVLEALLRDGEG